MSRRGAKSGSTIHPPHPLSQSLHPSFWDTSDAGWAETFQEPLEAWTDAGGFVRELCRMLAVQP